MWTIKNGIYLCLSILSRVDSFTLEQHDGKRIPRQTLFLNNNCTSFDDPTLCNTAVELSNRLGETSETSENGCVLPPHPVLGQWSIYGMDTPALLPGMWVSTGTALQIQCKSGHKLEGNSLLVCVNEKWTADVGRCLKTCPPRYSTAATKVICVDNGIETENCTDAIDGTIAKYECAPFYENLNLQRKPFHVCRYGAWSDLQSECTPICGKKPVSAQLLIVNGTITKERRYPWQVAIYYGQEKDFTCGGTLISQRIILTGAACVSQFPNPENYTVAVGKHYSKYDDPRDKNFAEFSTLDDLFIFKPTRSILLNDIAILVTTKTFTISQRVQPACVKWTSTYDPFSNSSGNIFGYVTRWGFTKDNGSQKQELPEINVPVIDCQKCFEDWPETVIRDKICAAVGGGDNGDGLFVEHNGRYYITGIGGLSFTTNGGECKNQPLTLYTNVSQYTDSFIHEKVIQYQTFQPQQTTENIGKCTLPPHPNNGRLSVLGSKLSSNPGTAVSSGTTIHVTCDESHVLQGPLSVECKNGQWDTPVGICLAPCPPLKSSPSMEVSCHGVSCIDNTHGTIATFKCAPFYENQELNINPFRTCENGEWTPRVPHRCVPVCGVKPEFDTQQNSDYPWNAAIYKKDEEGRKRFICAGTLINERIILTSAQCISGKDGATFSPTLFEAGVGKCTKDRAGRQDVKAQFSELEDIFVPDEYKGIVRRYRADIAVLITKKSFNMTQQVQLLCLDWKNTFAKEFEYPKIRGQIAAALESESSRQFLEIEVPFVDENQCYKQLSEDLELDSSYYTFDKFCSGYINLNNTSSCNLNLGTGLISKNRHDNRYYLTGIASVFASNLSTNCNDKKWVLFTQVSKYISSFIFEKNKLYTPLDTPYFQTSCGIKSVLAQTLIIDGNNVTKGDYPWQVALYRGSNTKKELFCGGSLINQRIILTAAHCVTDNQGNKRPKEMYTVAVGKYYRDFNHPDDKNAQFSPLLDIFVPDLYQGQLQNYVGDIAILITDKSFVLSREVMPICVDWENKYEGQLLRPYAKGYASGWGFTKEDSNPSQILKDLEVPYIERNQCKKDTTEDYEIYLTFDKICSGYSNKSKSICLGDSGGGLVFKNGIDDRYYITGIVSVSPRAPTGGCSSQQYTFYTRVSQYIKDFIGKKAQIFWR